MTDKERIKQLEKNVIDIYKLLNETLVESNKLLDIIIDNLCKGKPQVDKGEDK